MENYIAKERKLKPAQDYDYLRKLGLEYIQKLGSKFWTDYNAHDPGITILEVLSYAITELGYRTDFDIKNLLAQKNGQINNATFFPASTILINAPLTTIDYRKMLIDIEGVSNAWFLAIQKQTDENGFNLPNPSETNLYVNTLEDKLSLSDIDRNGNTIPKLELRGLNKIKIELEDDIKFGNLNTTVLYEQFFDSHKNRFVEVEVIPELNSWNHPKAKLLSLMNTPNKIKNAQLNIDQNIVKATYYRASNTTDFLSFTIKPVDPSEIDEVKKYYTLEVNSAYLIQKLLDKKKYVEKVLGNVLSQLHQNRNLAEDFLCVDTIDSLSIGVCVDVELQANSNPVEVMAQIQMTIDAVISPPIHFYTLSELVAEGLDSTEIFIGPKLNHGFLKTEEIEKAKLPTCIHTSDIIAALMKIKEVVSVKNLQLNAYDVFGKPIENQCNKKWCLDLSGDVKPVFRAEKSKILFFQQKVPFLLSEVDQLLVFQKVQLLKAQLRTNKLNDCKTDYDFPTGTFFQLDEFYSIQDEFPKNYHLGKEMISDKESPEMKAKIKQLKGYLHFYDQLLADFFCQLFHAKELLNSEDVAQTYFPKYLKENDKTKGDFYNKELYSNELETQLSSAKPLFNDTLFESSTTFFERRNRALDHMMARFGESFNEYVFMMYQVNQSNAMNLINQNDLIKDKQNFLNTYPIISSKRGIGVNYLLANSTANVPHSTTEWNSFDRNGYEKRVAKLLGINSLAFENIVTEDLLQPQTQWTVSLHSGSIVFKIVQPNSNLNEKWEFAQKYFYDSQRYAIDKFGKFFFIYLIQKVKEKDKVVTKKIAKIEKSFITVEEAKTFLLETVQQLNEKYENFYCLEHILLRPFPISQFNSDTADLLPVCLNDDCNDPANVDPYSFKITIVLPGYLFRFKNIKFRRYAEQIFRQEAPAHILVKICWVDNHDMQNFQTHYKNWLEYYGIFREKFCKNTLTVANKSNYSKLHRALLNAIKELNTIYPIGNLYNCELSETANPLVLGMTSLGTL